MGYYAYKSVRDQLPHFIIDAIPGYQGDADYDGDQWHAASDYIALLEGELIRLAQQGHTFADERLQSWLAPRITPAREGRADG